MQPKRRTARLRRWLAAGLLLGVAATYAGCGTVSYYAQAVRGECQMLARRQSCEKLITDSKTPADLKVKLQLARRLCDFASRELKLPAGAKSYRSYTDLERPYAVWNVYAAREFSLEPKSWWYPFVGSLEYRGFFAERSARDCAASLNGKNFDAYVEGVETYSTLGWFHDPLLNTFIHHKEAALAEIIFHELAHQRVFASGDTDFNEAFATAVGEEGVRRWLRSTGDASAMERYEAALLRNVQFVRLVAAARSKLEHLYGDERLPDGKIKRGKSRESVAGLLLTEKRRIFDELHRDYEQLKNDWGGYADYDDWFARGLNNAQLNSVATYYDLVPAFQRLLAQSDGDLEKFYAAAKHLAKQPKSERHRQLESIAGEQE